jgi:hypothetical protein
VTITPDTAVRIHSDVTRLGFLAALDAQTWPDRSRAVAALGDPTAIGTAAGYARWVRRLATAWSTVALPLQSAATAPWPFTAITPSCLQVHALLDADRRDLALVSGGPGQVPQLRAATRPAVAGEQAALVGAAYAVMVASADLAALAPVAALAMGRCGASGMGQRFLAHAATHVVQARSAVRADLKAWSASAGDRATDEAVGTAHEVMQDYADAVEASRPRGW